MRTFDITTTGAHTGVPRREVITEVLDLQNRPEMAARVVRRQKFEDWFDGSPLVEIVFDDERLRTASSRR
jgi:hypothetical protein